MNGASSSPQTSAPPVMNREGHASTDDQELIARSLKGDAGAFDELVAGHQDRIYNLCYWVLGQREGVVATQESFVRAFSSLEDFNSGEGGFGSWLHRIAVSTCLETVHRPKRTSRPRPHLRAQHNPPEPEPDPGLQVFSTPPPAEEVPQPTPEELAPDWEQREAVRRALAEIPAYYRLALVLFDIEGYSYEEIAQSLNLPEATAKNRINRARLAVRERLRNTTST